MENVNTVNAAEQVAAEAAVATSRFAGLLAQAKAAATSKAGIAVGATVAVGVVGYAGYRAYQSYKAKKDLEVIGAAVASPLETAAQRVRDAAETLKPKS